MIDAVVRRVIRLRYCIAGAALILAGGAVVYTIGNLMFWTDRSKLVSTDDRVQQLDRALRREFGARDTIVVAIENRAKPRTTAFARALAKRLENDRTNFGEVFYRIDVDAFAARALLYLSYDDLRSLERKITEHRDFIEALTRSPGLNTFFTQVNRKVTTGLVGHLFTGFLDADGDQEEDPGSAREPVDLSLLITTMRELSAWAAGRRTYTSAWERFFTGKEWKASPDGYLWSDDERLLFILITPQEAKANFNRAQDAVQRIRSAIAEVRQRYPDVEAGVTGPAALESDEMTAALRDTSLATVLSLLGLGVLLVLFFRGVARPLLGIITLGIGLCWTFGFATVAVGHLNILSVVFTPLLLGLGIDYSVHILARFEEARRLGWPLPEALARTLRGVGPAVLATGGTAALAFYALAFTDFKGLQELGIISGTGILITIVATLGVLPALLAIGEGGRVPEAATSRRSAPAARPDPFLPTAYRHPRAILVAGGAVTLLAGAGVLGVGFDINPLRLQNPKTESVRWELRLLEHAEGSSMFAELMAGSLDEARRKAAALSALRSVDKVESVLSLIPEDQERKLALLRSLQPLLDGLTFPPVTPVDLDGLLTVLDGIRAKMADPDSGAWAKGAAPLAEEIREVRSLIASFRRLARSRDRARVVQGLGAFQAALFDDLEAKLTKVQSNLYSGAMAVQDLPGELRRRFVGRDGSYVLKVFPKENIWERRPLAEFVADVRSVDADAVGEAVKFYEYTRAFEGGYQQAALYAFGAIFLLVLLDFRRLRDAVLAMVPLLVGAVWTVGLMRVLGVNFNLANVIFLPLIVGGGVENGIMILHRFREEEGRGAPVLPIGTGKGVTLASLTTMVGFGSLMISGHRGIYSLGLLLTLGAGTVLVASVTILPALLTLLRGREAGPGAAKAEAPGALVVVGVGADGKSRREGADGEAHVGHRPRVGGPVAGAGDGDGGGPDRSRPADLGRRPGDPE